MKKLYHIFELVKNTYNNDESLFQSYIHRDNKYCTKFLKIFDRFIKNTTKHSFEQLITAYQAVMSDLLDNFDNIGKNTSCILTLKNFI